MNKRGMVHKRNSAARHGVYTNMRPALLCFLCSLTVMAQAPRPPLDLAIQAYRTAHAEGRFDEAAAQRDNARALLNRTPVGAPQFTSWVQQVARLYQDAGMNLQFRAVVQEALARAGKLGDWHPTRIMLLNLLADSWQQDGSLLKSVAYLEQAIAAQESAPVVKAPAPGGEGGPKLLNGRVAVTGCCQSRFEAASNPVYPYRRLADAYQRLGRQEAIAGVLAKLRALIKNNDSQLATFYEWQGQFDEAAAIYRKQAEQASNSQEAAGLLQQVSNLYAREQRYAAAAATLQQAVDGLEASGTPQAHAQTTWMRQSIADFWRQAGQIEQGDLVYRQLLDDSQSGGATYLDALGRYAAYLGATNRAEQAAQLLNDYLANHADLQAGQDSNVLFRLSDLARTSGDAKRAEDYRRIAMDKRPVAIPQPQDRLLIGEETGRAQSAALAGKLDDAFTLTLHAIDASAGAPDQDQIAWRVASIARAMVQRKQPALAEQVYQRLFGAVQSWSSDVMQPLLNAARDYSQFLMEQPDRYGEVPAAIERYRGLLISANGADSGQATQAIRLTIDFERFHGSMSNAFRGAEDLLAFEESLAGRTSEPYMQAIELLGQLYQSTGDPEAAFRLQRQAVGITDLIYRPNDIQRAQRRINLAYALAGQQQFDEAEGLAAKAVAIGQLGRPQTDFANQLQQIRQMRESAKAR